MLQRLHGAVILAAVLISAPAAAADRMFQAMPAPASACGTPLAATGKAVIWQEPLDETTRTGLLAGVHLALREAAEAGWPTADVQAARDCPIARFAANDLIWTIHSGARGAPRPDPAVLRLLPLRQAGADALPGEALRRSTGDGGGRGGHRPADGGGGRDAGLL